ncbi:Glycosyltransferase, GT2 family [Soonwooa buanensis]|uniref:Glycosyltransferase, GT2 family n=1 Tax=Soonwooa buanensis TaxID=619805 RepID=A0A1T5EB47_9FLAO|nr:glycosyltransferase [Soonwooa buanensis]SKB81257.1 Glycosyltransferase, GT2 family [Soonwooa buanensis]
MSNQKKLAIVIPYYKIDYFKDTLDSLANQTNKDFNVYIGNDNGPNSPQDLLLTYQNKFDYEYTKFKENLGGKGELVQQWDRCIALSTEEEWIMILADDDYISHNFVEQFYKSILIANEKSINLLRFKMRRITHDNNFLVDHEQPLIHKGANYLWEDETHERFISISENVFRRSVYNKVGFRNYPLAWRVPYMMYLDFTTDGDVLGVNGAFVAIRRSENQLTRRNDVNQYKRHAMKQCYFDLLNEYEKSFNKNQNLHFLKIYHYYNKENNLLKQNFSTLFFKFGGIIGLSKYLLKKNFQKKSS